MIEIVGGVYQEVCHWPPRRQLYGSGGRAAAAVSGMLKDIRLSTYIGKDEQDALESIAGTFGFSINASVIEATTTFEYFHGLSVPRILPPPTEAATSLQVKGDHILRYGFVEGDAIVTGGTVVYDPQNVSNPVSFSRNGSKADRLAVVLNHGEGFLLTGKRNPTEIAQTVARVDKADVVVLKLGPHGALVWENGRSEIVPCFKTEFIWPLGSGDVFTAAFFVNWAVQGKSATESAEVASYSAALYCDSEVLPIAKERLDTRTFPTLLLQSPDQIATERSIYLAGPFFTMGQRWMVEEARLALRDFRIPVFSPFHDVGHGAANDIAVKDIEGLTRSSAVFAILDGLDSGTLFEVGYARAEKIPVIGFVQNEAEDTLKMMRGSGCTIEQDFVTAVYKTAWEVLESK